MKKLALILTLTTTAFAQIHSTLPSPTEQAQTAMAQAQAMAMQAGFAAQAAASRSSMAVSYSSLVTTSAAGVHNSMGVAMLSGQIATYSAMLRSPATNNMLMGSHFNLAMNNATMLSASLAHTQMLRQAAMVRGHALLAAAGQTPSASTPAQTPDTPDATSAAPPPMMIRPVFGDPLKVSKPNFSVKEGTVKAGTQIRLKTDTHYSALYYTTDGWTPTTQSMRYNAPITINDTTQLQVIAVGPNYMRSVVNHATFTVEGSKPAEYKPIDIPSDSTIRLGTPIHFTTAAEINSDDSNVGDKLKLELAQDIRMGDKVLAPKGSKIDAVLTIVDSSHDGPGPGDMVFELQSMMIGDKKVPVAASETMEGDTGAFSDKKTAIIKKGMTVTGFVAADTSLK